MTVLSDNLDEIERELRYLADSLFLGLVSHREVVDQIETIARMVAAESERSKR